MGYIERKWTEAKYEFWHGMAKLMLKLEKISWEGLKFDKLFWTSAAMFDKCFAHSRKALDKLLFDKPTEYLEVV